MPREIDIPPADTERFRWLLSRDRLEAFERSAEEARELLHGRRVWNVNSTARGGGVVELLQPLLAYARGAGIDTRWVVIDGTPEFFSVTKRIHHRLHGSAGDGGALDEDARGIYERVLADNAVALRSRIRAGDVVILHDPQTVGLAKTMRDAGATVIWRCHVGVDQPNELARDAWAFLYSYVAATDAQVFSREAFVWEGLDPDRVAVIPPTVDPFAPKNQELDPRATRAVLGASGLLTGGADPIQASFRRRDGSLGRIERRAMLFEDEPLPADAPAVVQVSRWDALKDPVGVIRGFAEHVSTETGAHLVYAGPAVAAVADDPEGMRILNEALAQRDRLPAGPRSRVHLACLPMDNPEENAIIVNALQRHASVIVQKSLAEGFGLTVAEAMWKGRPVVASRVGGIQDQIVDGDSGVLLDDPRDLAAFGAAVTGLLTDPRRGARLGERARERVRNCFLSVRSLMDHLEVIRRAMRPTQRALAA
jgi:trehalose synthase